MVTNTRKKLLCVRFYLERMKEIQNDQWAANCYLDAFLNAARSVIKIMETEFQNIAGFKEWLRQKNEGLKNDEINQLIFEKRRLSTYYKPIELRSDLQIDVSELIVVGTTMATVITYNDGRTDIRRKELIQPSLEAAVPSSIIPLSTNKGVRWYFNDLPERDVIDICQEHINKLEDVVSECESLFTLK